MIELSHFVSAQAPIYASAIAEIRAGRKQSHWMWFIFPQLGGLGRSPMARRYALASLEDARAYLAHPVLGPRYRDCVQALQSIAEPKADDVFGAVDAMKLRSSLTLFSQMSTEPSIATELTRWFGIPDPATITLLAGSG